MAPPARKILIWLVILVWGVSTAALVESVVHTWPEKLAQAEARYEALKAASLKAIADLTNQVKEWTAKALFHEKEAAKYLKEAKDTKAKLTVVSKQLADLQAQEPYYPELEGHPLVINLRAQIAKLTEQYSLALSVIEKQDLTITNLTLEVSDLRAAIDAWSAKYTKLEGLWHSSELLYADCKTAVKHARRKSLWKGLALGVAAGAVTLGLLK